MNDPRFGFLTLGLMKGIAALPYFDDSIYFNLNNAKKDKSYLTHQLNGNDAYLKRFTDNGFPELLN